MKTAASPVCTVCLDEVSGTDRSFVKLLCSHTFHLDCIGSAFNAADKMQCPNCRRVESGEWRPFEESRIQELSNMLERADDLISHYRFVVPFFLGVTSVSCFSTGIRRPPPPEREFFNPLLFLCLLLTSLVQQPRGRPPPEDELIHSDLLPSRSSSAQNSQRPHLKANH